MRGGNVCRLVAVVVGLCLAGVSWAGQSIVYVDAAATGGNDGSSWTDAYGSLQEALTTAKEVAKPLEIRVAQGVYTPPDRRTPFELLNGVTFKGGYAGVADADPNTRDVTRYTTVLSAELENGDTAPRVLDGSLTDSTAVVDGFTITPASPNEGVRIANGSPTFVDCRFIGDTIHAMIEASDCNSVLIGCRFEGNTGAGIYCEEGHLTLRDCAFVHNDDRVITIWGTLDLLRCSFVDNGGKVYCEGMLVARSCRFVGNSGSEGAILSSGISTLEDCVFLNNRTTSGNLAALSLDGDSATLTRCLFAGNSTWEHGGGAILSSALVLKLSHCLFAGNAGSETGPGAVFQHGFVLEMSNCTFVDNRGLPSTFWLGPLSGAVAELTQCIVWDGPEPFAPMGDLGRQLSVTYSNVQGRYEGKGNFDADPCFVAPGYWDPNGTPDDPNDDVWIMGDYHLQSQAGHWDQETENWVYDEVTSPCIDAGDPNGPRGVEPVPNGGFVNLGAYGGTAEASRSYFGGPVCETQIAGDINGDCKVDDLDLDILMSHWLMPDIGKANIPPTITIISPEDGAELTEPIPIICRVDASDPDGTILQVEYTLKYDDGHNSSWRRRETWDATDGWRRTLDWSTVRYDGPHEIWAEAVDDDGAITVSPPITVTLQRAE